MQTKENERRKFQRKLCYRTIKINLIYLVGLFIFCKLEEDQCTVEETAVIIIRLNKKKRYMQTDC